MRVGCPRPDRRAVPWGTWDPLRHSGGRDVPSASASSPDVIGTTTAFARTHPVFAESAPRRQAGSHEAGLVRRDHGLRPVAHAQLLESRLVRVKAIPQEERGPGSPQEERSAGPSVPGGGERRSRSARHRRPSGAAEFWPSRCWAGRDEIADSIPGEEVPSHCGVRPRREESAKGLVRARRLPPGTCERG